MARSLNRPERERLPCLKAGILIINKIKPTVAIRNDLRLIFSESESIECAVIFSTPDLNGYEKLITRRPASYHMSHLEALVD
jgi:hypothetical protein